jgi:hypothetical protein
MNRIFCHPLLRTVMAVALVVLGVGLSGCADMSDTVGLAFADPAKYDLYNCKQLETERKTLASKAAELQGLMEGQHRGCRARRGRIRLSQRLHRRARTSAARRGSLAA